MNNNEFLQNDVLDNDILIDLNDDDGNNIDLDLLKKIIYDFPMVGFTEENITKKRNVIDKMINYFHEHNIYKINSAILSDNVNIIDNDMFDIGNIENTILTLDIPPVSIGIDLSRAINLSIKSHQNKLLDIIFERKLNPLMLCPDIMSLLATHQNYYYINKIIESNIPLYDFDFIYILTADGYLDIILRIITTFNLQNSTEIICKICVQAVIHNRLNILQYFLTDEIFINSPEQMFTFFIQSIRHGGHLDIVKFFVEHGINPKQNNNNAIHTALHFKRKSIIKYFVNLYPDLIDTIIDLVIN
ncbi:putative ankyrin repeat protein [Cotonvirus japonicus]|uniref:Ankyrin repeat protein n=1 Tax=Cotonvirus japonicus TaxID=2811091 RepID=A0ABM7NT46_9VIRU|nr:putative ankyrin repeat protein [Cotonvirus japonicus]BCS83350.1 putative ankyrin repeat protein [Cotonvirus japonicus]